MIKNVTFKCTKCGKDHSFEVGSGKISTLQDAVDKVPARDADKLLETVNTMMMNKDEAQRTEFLMNQADGLSMINYEVCGQSINLFDSESVKSVYGKYSPEQIDKLNKSMSMWLDTQVAEGFVAFNAIFYCRKCKKLTQGMYFSVRSVEDKKERIFKFNQKCAKCGNELTLVNDANMGYMFEGLTARAPCPECGGAIVATEVKFKP